MFHSSSAECGENVLLAFGEMRPTFEVRRNNDCIVESFRCFDSLFRGQSQVKRANFRNSRGANVQNGCLHRKTSSGRRRKRGFGRPNWDACAVGESRLPGLLGNRAVEADSFFTTFALPALPCRAFAYRRCAVRASIVPLIAPITWKLPLLAKSARSGAPSFVWLWWANGPSTLQG
jgi:hypothetical protein